VRTKEEFLSLVDKTDSCWLWKGGKHGSVNWQGSVIPIRRLAWIIQKGEIEVECRIRTSCGNPLCVSPEHLSMKKVGKDAPTVLKEAKPAKRKRPEKLPLVVPDRSPMSAVLQGLADAAIKLEEKGDRALIACSEAHDLMAELLIKASEARDRLDDVEKLAQKLFKRDDFKAMAEEGLALIKNGGKRE
jgi:hypothetical protein